MRLRQGYGAQVLPSKANSDTSDEWLVPSSQCRIRFLGGRGFQPRHIVVARSAFLSRRFYREYSLATRH